MILLGLTGNAQHGKDTAGRVLLTEFGVQRYSFAGELKEMALELNPFVDREMNYRLQTVVADRGWEEAKQLPEVRRFLQRLGTEAVRNHLGEDSWIRALSRKLDAEKPDRAVITDVRFPNEADMVRNYGGLVWRIKRIGEDGKPYFSGIGTDHPSERLLERIRVDRVLTAANVQELANAVSAAYEESLRQKAWSDPRSPRMEDER